MSMLTDLGPVQPLMDDPFVTEIMINGLKKIFIEKGGQKSLTDVNFKTQEELSRFIDHVLAPTGKSLDQSVPYLDACLADGSRVNIILPPVSRFGTSVTIRKFSKEIQSLDDLVKNGTLPRNVADFLTACVKGKINMLFSGGTGVGKTTLLQVLSCFFTPQERIVTVEDTAELRLAQDNTVSLETRRKTADTEEVTIRDLIRNTLRMAPDRIIIGEIRGVEVIDMIQAMATGHDGTIGVIHGNSPREVVARLETMILMSGYDLPHSEIRKMIGSTIQLIVHHEKFSDGARKITRVTEIRGMERNEILFNDLFSYQKAVDAKGQTIGVLKSCLREYPLFYQRFQDEGLLKENVFK